MVYLTRKEHFNAAHRVYNPEWSDEQNLEVFGKCSNPNWHGHNYNLYVTVKGEPDPITGYVTNAKHLSNILNERVIDYLDHKNLNLDVEFMDGIQPTTENLAKAIWKEIEPYITDCSLHSIRIHETESIYVEYFGDK